jgi:hypothetical protein
MEFGIFLNAMTPFAIAHSHEAQVTLLDLFYKHEIDPPLDLLMSLGRGT